jgi:hypothetical protein
VLFFRYDLNRYVQCAFILAFKVMVDAELWEVSITILKIKNERRNYFVLLREITFVSSTELITVINKPCAHFLLHKRSSLIVL